MESSVAFRICGLCSKLVDGSMTLPKSLIDFLVISLNVENYNDIPTKSCIECYQAATNSKKFKESFDSTLIKLKEGNIADSMVLGKSNDNRRVDKPRPPKVEKQSSFDRPKPKPAQSAIDESLIISGSRTRRTPSSKSFHNSPQCPPCSVQISYTESNLANQAHMKGGTLSYDRKRKGLSTPTRLPPKKRALNSGVGQSNKPKKGYAYVPIEETGPAKVEPVSSKRKPKPTAKSFYYVDNNGADVENKVEIDDANNTDEIFPSIGPYQCEICQVITSTKQEFVVHIKKYHRDVVDEEVLRSLEADIKKAKSKAISKAKGKQAARGKQRPKSGGVTKQKRGRTNPGKKCRMTVAKRVRNKALPTRKAERRQLKRELQELEESGSNIKAESPDSTTQAMKSEEGSDGISTIIHTETLLSVDEPSTAPSSEPMKQLNVDGSTTEQHATITEEASANVPPTTVSPDIPLQDANTPVVVTTSAIEVFSEEATHVQALAQDTFQASPACVAVQENQVVFATQTQSTHDLIVNSDNPFLEN